MRVASRFRGVKRRIVTRGRSETNMLFMRFRRPQGDGKYSRIILARNPKPGGRGPVRGFSCGFAVRRGVANILGLS